MDNLIIFTIVVIVAWLTGLSLFLYKTTLHYRRLIEGTGKKNLAEILDKILDALSVDKKNIETLSAQLKSLGTDVTYHIQKVGILRFNPFADTGGEQSFVLSVLDGTDTGVVLTSLHSRGVTRWYIKNVKEGKGVDYDLSEEELKAIKQATHIKKRK